MRTYSQIKSSCAITTAACNKYAPYLLAMLSSLDRNFPLHPRVYIYDLGMKKRFRNELCSIPWVTLLDPFHFAPHWRQCYSWKPYLMLVPTERYVLQIDAGCIILRPLDALFLLIDKVGYLLFDQGQTLDQVTYSKLWDRVGLSEKKRGKEQVFAAGIFGFDSQSPMADAVKEAALLSKEGWTLGYSEIERHRIKKSGESIIRNCSMFRHDQTVINLTVRNQYTELHILNDKHIPCVENYQKKAHIWNCRRNFPKSLYWFYVSVSRKKYFFLNRVLEFRALIIISNIHTLILAMLSKNGIFRKLLNG